MYFRVYFLQSPVNPAVFPFSTHLGGVGGVGLGPPPGVGGGVGGGTGVGVGGVGVGPLGVGVGVVGVGAGGELLPKGAKMSKSEQK